MTIILTYQTIQQMQHSIINKGGLACWACVVLLDCVRFWACFALFWARKWRVNSWFYSGLIYKANFAIDFLIMCDAW